MTLEARAPDADGDTVELWRDGVLIDSALVAGGVARFERAVSGARERYRVHLVGATGLLTVTSPVYVEGTPVAVEDGCCSSGGAPASSSVLGLGLVALGVARRRRRG